MFQRSAALCSVMLAASLTASADFSYTTTQKMTGGAMAAMAGASADCTSKIYFKGQKMMTSTGDTATLMDFGAQTITIVNNAQKTYTVRKFGDMGATAGNTDVTFDVKETGQKKVVNGFNVTETIVAINMDMDAGRGGPPVKMQMEMELWISSDVPGVGEMRAFYEKNLASFPWAAISGGGGNASMQKAMGQMERKLAELNGVAVERVVRVKSPGGTGAPQAAQMPQMTPAQQAQMQKAMAQMQEMAKQGGPAAAAAQQAMARMGAMAGGAAPSSASGAGSMMEMTIDASGFSNASVPDSVFAIPSGYKQKE
jgi:hypothetical protein